MKLQNVSARYIYLAISSIALAGIYSILLVFLRSPGLSSFFSLDIFKTSLVIHVNLSVLVWMLSVCASLWFYKCSITDGFKYYVNYSNYICVIGVILMFISPMIAETTPILNNYVPMLDNWCFVTGLVIFIIGILFSGFLGLITQFKLSITTIKIGNICSILILLQAVISCTLSYFALDKLLYPMDLHFYYEMFFWSAGHILQFCFVEIMMIVQILLLENIVSRSLSYHNIYRILLIINCILAVPGLFPHLFYSIDSPEFLEFFSLHMKYCGSIAPSFMFIVLLSEYYNVKSSTSNNCFIISSILFFLGGVIGLLISGANVTIPAHYHGSIVGITVALMGYIYLMLGINNKYSFYQPYIYGGGQIIHIVALAWSGGYGVMRKLPGAELSIKSKISMGLMGIGGGLAILGGLMFVYICMMSIFYKKSEH